MGSWAPSPSESWEEVALASERNAAAALQAGRAAPGPTVRRDIDDALGRLGVPLTAFAPGESRSAGAAKWAAPGDRVWLLRMIPVRHDRLDEARVAGVITIGWGEADGLTDPGLTRDRFRDEVVRPYYSDARDACTWS